MHILKPRSVVVGVVGLILLAMWGEAEAQMRVGTAEVVQLRGRVDTLGKGQPNWTATTVGARLGEGDQIRALAGGSADLNLPDGSTILLAENSRFAVTKLDYDVTNRDRDASFHLVAGKVRAQVSQAAVQVVRARQSNFNISTPTGVAAVRGTIVITAFNPVNQEMLTFVFASPNQLAGSARVTVAARAGGSVTVTGGQFVRQVGNQPPGSPLPTTAAMAVQANSAQNTTTAGSNDLVVVNVTIPSAGDTQNIVNTATGGGPGDRTTTGTGGETTNTGGDFSGVGPGPTGPPPKVDTCQTPPCEPQGLIR